eukprot:4711298-Pleurochrysis_carterae.AAC.4
MLRAAEQGTAADLPALACGLEGNGRAVRERQYLAGLGDAANHVFVVVNIKYYMNLPCRHAINPMDLTLKTSNDVLTEK